MLLESRIDDRTTIVIDAEAAGGIDKGALSVSGHPDRVVSNGISAIRALAKAFTEGFAGDGLPPEMDLTFALRVDSNAVVSLSRRPDEGQFRVTMRWRR
jgi:hypothetical protein